MTDTIAAIATPAQGAIAIVKLSGTKSLEILQTLTHRQHFPLDGLSWWIATMVRTC